MEFYAAKYTGGPVKFVNAHNSDDNPSLKAMKTIINAIKIWKTKKQFLISEGRVFKNLQLGDNEDVKLGHLQKAIHNNDHKFIL